MASGDSNGYLIFRLEKVGILDILRLLFTRRRLIDYDFVESSGVTDPSIANAQGNWVIALVLAVRMLLGACGGILSLIGRAIEFLVNLPSFNGGFRGLLWRVFTASVVSPRRAAKEFRSIVAHNIGHVGVRNRGAPLPAATAPSPAATGAPLSIVDLCAKLTVHSKPPVSDEDIHLTVMAASKAYENEANIKDAVENDWKMHFVGYYDFWNKFAGKAATHAFVFCDKDEDAELICVAFRGTNVFDAADWQTDLDFSFVSLGSGRGNVHLGFLKALGLQQERNFDKGFPKEPPAEDGDKPLAYYAIRNLLADLMERHPKARILMTGHSLGGALAALFPALLAVHEETTKMDREKAILGKMTVITHAQPRVGNGTFRDFMESVVGNKYYRTVYRYDLVPRVPPASRVVNFFQHFGTCVYYSNWYHYKLLKDVPNANYFNPIYVCRVYWSAWVDLVRAIYVREGFVSVMYRFMVGILIPIVGPGIVSHNTRNYVNGAVWAKKAKKSSKEKSV